MAMAVAAVLVQETAAGGGGGGYATDGNDGLKVLEEGIYLVREDYKLEVLTLINYSLEVQAEKVELMKMGIAPGNGGNGAGIIFISASSIINSGAISANGEDGGDGTNNNPNGSNGGGCGMGGGGGGAGGSIFISSSVSGSGIISADKGDLGTAPTCGRAGGDGSVGRIAIASPGSSFPTTSPVANEASLPVISGHTLTCMVRWFF